MFRSQIKFQKIVAVVLLVMSVVTIVYSLGLLTDVYRVLFNVYDPDKEGSKYTSPIPTVEVPTGETDENGNAITEERDVVGGKLFYDMQPFNSQLLGCAIAVLLVCITNFVTNGNKRRNYYIGNFISVGLICAVNIGVSIFCMAKIAYYRGQFVNGTDFEALKIYCEQNNYYYSDSTFWFDIGFAVFALLLVATALLAYNLVWKLKLMKKEKCLLNGEEVAA